MNRPEARVAAQGARRSRWWRLVLLLVAAGLAIAVSAVLFLRYGPPR